MCLGSPKAPKPQAPPPPPPPPPPPQAPQLSTPQRDQGSATRRRNARQSLMAPSGPAGGGLALTPRS